jgi:hypothetical protein
MFCSRDAVKGTRLQTAALRGCRETELKWNGDNACAGCGEDADAGMVPSAHTSWRRPEQRRKFLGYADAKRAPRYECNQRIDGKDGLDVETTVQSGSTMELQKLESQINCRYTVLSSLDLRADLRIGTNAFPLLVSPPDSGGAISQIHGSAPIQTNQ